MARPRSKDPRIKQLLLRMTERQMEILESVAHLERTTPNGYAHQVLIEHLGAMAKNPRVQADIKNRTAYECDNADTAPIRRARA